MERVTSAESIEVEYRGRSLKVQAPDWKLAQSMTLSDLRARRLCLYGRGVVWPWSDCPNHTAADMTERSPCQAGLECRFSPRCPKLRSLSSYVV